MARTGRLGISAEQKIELWRRWKAGETLSDIGRALSKHAGSIFGVLVAKGGIAPAIQIRRAIALSVAEREEIARGLAVGASFRQLACHLGRAPSTISREVARNGGRRRYRPSRAEERAAQQSLRPKPCRLATYPALRDIVADRLQKRWSPHQVSGWLKITYPNRQEMQLSHETIYRSLFVQARGVLKKELMAHLRSRRVMRRGKTASTAGQTRGQIIGAVSIRERPAEIEDRAIPGHWEGDLLSGARNSHIATLVERRSRFVMLVQVGGKDSESVVEALVRQVHRLPQGLMASLTWDRGTELAFHRQFTLATDVAVYFCDPQSPWQRGSNENTNGLLRQYFPRGMDLSGVTQGDLDEVALSQNTRPRKTLGYRTPADTPSEGVALTG
jgi:IS30 family transposase